MFLILEGLTLKNEPLVLLKSVGLCGVFCIIIAAVVAVLLRTPLLAGQKAYLYRLLAYDAIACVVLLAVLVPVTIKRGELFGLSMSSVVMCVGLSTLAMALFLALGPMPIERSYTIYSLAEMADSEKDVYSAGEIKTQFIEGFIEEANESQKRIDEQVYIGNLEQTDEGYRITAKGQRLIKLMRLVESIFPVPDKTCIYPNGKLGR